MKKKKGLKWFFAFGKPWQCKWWVWAVLALFISIPFIINCLYLKGAKLSTPNTSFSASDLLVLYGMVIGTIGTIMGVFLSIRYAQRNYLEDTRNRVLPFFSIHRLTVNCKVNLFGCSLSDVTNDSKTEDKSYEYQEKGFKECYYIIDSKGAIAHKDLTKEQRENVRSVLVSLKNIDIYYLPRELENVGNGVAVNMRFGFNKVNPSEKAYRYTLPIDLCVGQKIYIGLYFDMSDKELKDMNFEFSIVYEDIMQNKYIQRYMFHINEKQAISEDTNNVQKVFGGTI